MIIQEIWRVGEFKTGRISLRWLHRAKIRLGEFKAVYSIQMDSQTMDITHFAIATIYLLMPGFEGTMLS